MMYFLRLIRPVNLAVIALTMYAVQVFFMPLMHPWHDPTINQHIPEEVTHYISSSVSWNLRVDYFLLVFSTILIAAAGNIINDYFDVKADRVNRPEKLIITKHIKPRWAILWHWVLNFVAFAIACYLSWRYETFWYVFIHLFSINALWFYSMYFKRKFLIGNVLIAFLTALVSLLSGFYFLNITNSLFRNREYLYSYWGPYGADWLDVSMLPALFVIVFAAFAFALNLVREIVKDVEDMEGDKMLRAKTIPLVLGIAKTRWICISLLVAILVVAAPFIIEGYTVYSQNFMRFMCPALLIVALLVFCIVQLLLSTERKALKRTDFAIKLAMIIGCCMPYYWYFL